MPFEAIRIQYNEGHVISDLLREVDENLRSSGLLRGE